MTSPSREFLRSPFENVFQILPQGHDKALKQAFYNTAATLFVVFASCAAIAVYYILEPFLRPLLWATLCGTFLFPFKYTLTNLSRKWLHHLQLTGTPLVVGIVLMPVTLVDSASDVLGNFWWNNVYVIIVGCIVIPFLYLIFYIWPIHALMDAFTTTFCFVYEALSYFNALWVSVYIIMLITLIILNIYILEVAVCQWGPLSTPSQSSPRPAPA